MIFNKNMLIATAVALVISNNAVMAQSSAAAVASTTADASAATASTEAVYTIPNAKIAWKESYPSAESKPVPKAEWLALVKDDAVLKVTPNVLTVDGVIQNADPTGKNANCNWTWDGCVKPTDIVHCTDKTVWGTSFDDGPYEITRELLAYLKTIDVKVTFFVVGKQVLAWPEILKEAYDQGHEIGIHTWDHSELTTISNDMIIGQLKWTEVAIKEVLGVTPRLMRPPRGDIDDRVRYIVNQLGYTPAMWSVDSQDWRITAGGQTEAGLLGNVTEWVNSLSTLTQGGNSLMHDLNNVTVGAAIKALPILHPHVKLSPVGVCAGWNNASYLETAANVAAPAASSAVAPGASNTADATQNPTATAIPAAKKVADSGAASFKNPIVYTTVAVALTALISNIF